MKNLLLVPLLLLSGCAFKGVPSNKISLTGPMGTYVTDFPKDVDITGFKAEVDTNKIFRVTFKHWASKNNPQVLNSAGAADVARMEAISSLVQSIAAVAAQAAATAAKSVTLTNQP